MRVHPRLFMATPTAAGSTKGFRPAPLALLPPIPLYRRLLRAHRKHLPREMRVLGDEYIKSEFRAHRDVENPVHIVRGRFFWKINGLLANALQIGFLTEWQMYAQKLEGDSWKGERMDMAKVEKMSGTLLFGTYLCA
jgi:Complex1_LYR-like